MKTRSEVLLLIAIFLFLSIGCERKGAGNTDISYQVVDQEYVLIRDIQLLKQSDDPISDHIDSILSGLINEEFVSTGQKDFNLDPEPDPDIAFEIIDLNKFNPHGLPESFDSLAARVIPLGIQILDNSTYGYPDALDEDMLISEEGNWTERTAVLGTFMNAGQFQGQGNKFLGFRFTHTGDPLYGWIRIYCSQHNDTLRIIDYAFNKIEGSQILAGQTE